MVRRATRMVVLRRVLALAPLLTLLAALPSHVVMRCRFDGQVRAACCCPSTPDTATGQSVTAVSAAECCDRLEVGGQSMPGDQARHARTHHDATVLVALVSHRVLGPLPVDARAASATSDGRAPPGAPVALVLLKHAFLI